MKLRWTSISNADTGFVFTQTHGIDGPYWPWVREAVAAEYDLDEEDLDLTEDGDREFVVTASGALIAEVHHCYKTGYVADARDVQPKLSSGRDRS